VLGDGHGRVYWLVLDELVPLRSGGVERELRSSLVAERRRVACPERREVDANQSSSRSSVRAARRRLVETPAESMACKLDGSPMLRKSADGLAVI